jgi:hypothetical protein
VGLADQQPASYADPRARALGLRYARLTVPWDAATSQPQAVAAYYDELRAACAGCTVVAGDVLDSGSYRRWLERFLRASTTTPRLWGLHDYGDVTYGRTTGVDTVLATVPGALWIEETGGLVALRNAAGRATFAATEASAATAIDRAFAIAAARPRIARMYVYQWRAHGGDRFDAGSCAPTAAPARATQRSRATSRRSAPCAGGRRGPHGAPGACCSARRARRAPASAAAG